MKLMTLIPDIYEQFLDDLFRPSDVFDPLVGDIKQDTPILAIQALKVGRCVDLFRSPRDFFIVVRRLFHCGLCEVLIHILQLKIRPYTVSLVSYPLINNELTPLMF